MMDYFSRLVLSWPINWTAMLPTNTRPHSTRVPINFFFILVSKFQFGNYKTHHKSIGSQLHFLINSLLQVVTNNSFETLNYFSQFLRSAHDFFVKIFYYIFYFIHALLILLSTNNSLASALGSLASLKLFVFLKVSVRNGAADGSVDHQWFRGH